LKSWRKLLTELKEKEERAKLGGGLDKQKAQKATGKMLCRERINTLVDPGSFVEINMLAETQTFEFDMQKKRSWEMVWLLDLLRSKAVVFSFFRKM
jgi:acetyl-CoA carboxylase carboxyltransferase component